MIEESRRTRYLFLDIIKVLFTILIIFWHTTVTYVDVGWWYYKAPNIVDPLTDPFFLIIAALGGIFQTALLGLFFLLGGYFTPKSYDRKGIGLFWKERLIRLGIPLLLYIILINPILILVLSKLNVSPWNTDPRLQGSFLTFYFNQFSSLSSFIDFISFSGPMWFLRLLLIFTFLYTVWNIFSRFKPFKKLIPKDFPIPNYTFLLLFALSLGLITFIVRIFFSIDNRPLEIPWGQFFQYLTMFSFGVICMRYLWFDKITPKQVRFWSITIIISTVVIFLTFIIGIDAGTDIIAFQGGINIYALIFSIIDSIICVGVLFVLIEVFYAKFNHQGVILRNLSHSAYYMYLVHPPILIATSLFFSSVTFYPILKVTFVFLLTILFCYLTSHFLIEKIHLKKTNLRVSPSIF